VEARPSLPLPSRCRPPLQYLRKRRLGYLQPDPAQVLQWRDLPVFEEQSRQVAWRSVGHRRHARHRPIRLGRLAHACKAMGFSRDTYYRYQSAVEAGGVDALIDANRKKPNLKNRVKEAQKPLWSPSRWSSRPLGRFGLATSCAY
jgi:hypothetical protein